MKQNNNYFFSCICLLSSSRAKAAGNSNDAGAGADESDLEKMKQVNFSSAQQHQSLTKCAEPKNSVLFIDFSQLDVLNCRIFSSLQRYSMVNTWF